MLDSKEIPEAWIGREVYVGLLTPTKGSAPAAGSFKTGTLQSVNVWGIVGAFTDPLNEDEEPVSVFYPWSAVLQIADKAEVDATV